MRTTVEAPADLGIDVIGVPPGSPVELDLRLESVVEGVLVTGTATVAVHGECVRCLGAIADRLEVDVQELFVYPGSEATEDEASRLEGDLIDLEPLLRDDVVLDLPFQPLCRPTALDCARSAVPNLNDDPSTATRRRSTPGGLRWLGLRAATANLRCTNANSITGK